MTTSAGYGELLPMLDGVRDALYRPITTLRGDSLLRVRIPKDLARRLNASVGAAARTPRRVDQPRARPQAPSPPETKLLLKVGESCL